MANRYWVGGAGAWDDSAHWSTTSGGAGGASVPTSADSVYFNSSSGSGLVSTSFTLSVALVDTSGFTGSFSGSGTFAVYGSGTTTRLSSGLVGLSGVSFIFYASSAFDPNGATVKDLRVQVGIGNTLDLLSVLTVSGTLTLTSGNFYAGTRTLNVYYLSAPSSGPTITFTTGTLNITYGFVFGASTIFVAGTSTLNILGSGGVQFGGNSFATVVCSSSLTASGSGTFSTFAISSNTAVTVTVAGGIVTTAAFSVSSGVGVVHSIVSSSPGSQFRINCTTGTQVVQNLNVKDCDANGSTIICQNGVDSGNNTNWLFYNNSGAIAFF